MARLLISFEARSNSPPSAVLTASIPVTRQNATTGQSMDLLAFADAGTTGADFYGRMPPDYNNGNLSVSLAWLSDATSGNGRWTFAFLKYPDDSVDFDVASAFDTAKAIDVACPDVAGETAYDSVSFTNAEADDVQAGQRFCLRLTREPTHANDTLGALAFMADLEIHEA